MALFGILCILLGMAIGVCIGARIGRRRDRAPAPVQMGYDVNNPINGGLNAKEKVVICGAEWEVIRP